MADTNRRIKQPVQKHKRVPLRFRTSVEDPKTRTLAVTANLSEGGVFVEMADPPTPGSIVGLEVVVGKKVLRATGEVIWARNSTCLGEGKPCGAGIRFLAVPEFEALRDSIDRMSTSSKYRRALSLRIQRLSERVVGLGSR